MGSENDKRLETPTITKVNSEGAKKNTTENNYYNQPKQERINPYDASRQQQNPQNIKNAGGMYPQPQMLARSMTSPKKNTVTLKMLKDAFKTYSIDNDYLNRARFNDAIESIFRFNIPEMHYTYLSDKIYDLLDSSGDGKIQEDEFLDGFGRVLKDRKFRLLLSMMAMMSLPDKTRDYIEINEIKEFFYQSFIQGYKHLGWQIRKHPNEFKDNNLPVATIEQLGKWASKYEKEVKTTIEKEIKTFSPNLTNIMTFSDFMRWISNDNTIYIQYGNKNISIATSLIRLDDINYEETVAGNIGSYPSI